MPAAALPTNRFEGKRVSVGNFRQNQI